MYICVYIYIYLYTVDLYTHSIRGIQSVQGQFPELTAELAEADKLKAAT